MPYGLYPPMPRSPITYLSDGIDASVTTIPVDDVSKLPVAPNIATIGDGVDSETVKYTGKTASSLTGVTRGFEGEARVWNSGVPIANVPCAQHFRALQVNVVPYGCILMWSGAIANIPLGWALCDGRNGTPDLRDRFILGVAASEEPGATGGAHNKTLAVGNLPAHKHTFTTNNQDTPHKHTVTIASGGAHNHTGRYRGYIGLTPSKSGNYHDLLRRIHSGDPYDGTVRITHTSEGAHTHTTTVGNQSAAHKHGGTTNDAGSGTALDVRPKYFKLAFIMKVV